MIVNSTITAEMVLLSQKVVKVLTTCFKSWLPAKFPVVVVALLTFLGSAGNGQEAEDGEGFELHFAGDWNLTENECKEPLS
jgi:hypothetical protein